MSTTNANKQTPRPELLKARSSDLLKTGTDVSSKHVPHAVADLKQHSNSTRSGNKSVVVDVTANGNAGGVARNSFASDGYNSSSHFDTTVIHQILSKVAELESTVQSLKTTNKSLETFLNLYLDCEVNVLHKAILHNHPEAARLLLNKGADPNAKGVDTNVLAGYVSTYIYI